MKITIVCDVLGAENNGTTIAAMNLIRGMKKRGHEVTVLCCDQDKKGMDGFVITPVRKFWLLDSYIKKVGVQLAKADKNIVYSAVKGADVVHCLLPFKLSRAAISIAKKLGIPLTGSFHCQAENFSSNLKLKNFWLFNLILYKRYYHTAYKKLDAVHYPSQFICDYFEKRTKPTNHYVISNGVHGSFLPHRSAKPESLSGAFVILSTGRYSEEKCQIVLLQALAASKYKSSIHLVLAGCGPLDKKYERFAAKHGISITMKLFPREELLEVIGYTDLYVHPADIEIEGIACTEAIRCGLVPIVSDSNRSAARYFAHDERSLFRTGSAKSLRERIEYWYEHPEERAAASKQYAQSEFCIDQEVCMDKMEQMFFDVVNKGRES